MNRLANEDRNGSVDEEESCQYNERNELTKRIVTGNTASISKELPCVLIRGIKQVQ